MLSYCYFTQSNNVLYAITKLSDKTADIDDEVDNTHTWAGILRFKGVTMDTFHVALA